MTEKFENIQFTKIIGPVSIEDISILNGANYFSGEKVIRFRINLGEYDERPTNEILGFFESLKQLLPTLYQHHCSLKKPGGFFERMQEGTLLGHVIEHVAIELQTLAGMNVGFGKTRVSKQKGVYNVVFRFFDEIAGEYAGVSSVNLVNSILLNQAVDIASIVHNLIFIRENRMLGFSTQAIVEEAENRNIPALRLDEYNLVQLGTGKYRKIIRATITQDTSLIAVEITDNKFKTGSILREYGVPIPERIITGNEEDAIAFFKKHKTNLVIKPSLGGYQGKRVSVNLKTEKAIKEAFAWAKEFDEEVIVQQYVKGDTYRVLVIDFKFAAAVHLKAPHIIGDGISSIQNLINKLNEDPVREIGDKGKLSKLVVDEETLKIISLKNYTIETVLPKNEILHLKNSGNMKLGSFSTDVTEIIHPYNIFVCERISRILNLNVAGIDIISPDITKPINENEAYVIEVNAAPDFRMHINPSAGEPRLVQKKYVEMLFPEGQPSHIPIISITGSRGKTLLANLLKFIFRKTSLNVGISDSQGVFVGNHCIRENVDFDTVHPSLILKDPTIDLAVIETNVETILQYGLGYKFAEIAVVLNLDETKQEYFEHDHIRDIDDIAYAKSVVAEEVNEPGFSILNADSELIADMAFRIYSKAFLFSHTDANEDVKAHCLKNGKAVFIRDEKIILFDGQAETEILPYGQVVLPYLIQEPYVKDVVLAFIAIMHLQNISHEQMILILCDPSMKDYVQAALLQ